MYVCTEFAWVSLNLPEAKADVAEKLIASIEDFAKEAVAKELFLSVD